MDLYYGWMCWSSCRLLLRRAGRYDRIPTALAVDDRLNGLLTEQVATLAAYLRQSVEVDEETTVR